MCRVHPWPGMARVEDLHGEAERRLQPDGAMDGRAVGHPADLFPLPASKVPPDRTPSEPQANDPPAEQRDSMAREGVGSPSARAATGSRPEQVEEGVGDRAGIDPPRAAPGCADRMCRSISTYYSSLRSDV